MLRIIFMGNPEFALPTLQLIRSSGHILAGVVSNPPKALGRGRKIQKTAVGSYAEKENLNLIMPKDLNGKNFVSLIKKLRPDIFVIVAYKILPDKIIQIPQYGALNLHASLLPKYRGAAPIQWAIMNGDSKTGVTIFQIVSKVDAGDILLQKEIKIKDNDNYLSLGTRLCEVGSKMIIQSLNRVDKNTIKLFPQNSSLATSAPKISKEMLLINWSWDAFKINNWIRGLSPYPGMRTKIKKKSLRIFKSKVVDKIYDLKPGTVINSDNCFLIATGKGGLMILDLQIEGKKRMKTEIFLRGFNLDKGQIIG